MKRFLFFTSFFFVTIALAQSSSSLSAFLKSDDLDQCEAKYESNGLTLNKITIIKDTKISQRAYCFSFLPELSSLLNKNKRIFRLLTTQPFSSALHITDDKKLSYDDREGILTIHSNIDATILAAASALEKKLEKDFPFFEFSGVAKNVSIADLVGWKQCHKSTYADSGAELAKIKSDCNGKKVLIACTQVGSTTLEVAAMGDKSEVFKIVGTERGDHHTHNGVEFYFSDSHSMGFAAEGTGVDRNTCDIAEGSSSDRLCWHTTNGTIDSGYRCGENQVGRDKGWQRLIFTSK